jgi:hypothetical protein
MVASVSVGSILKMEATGTSSIPNHIPGSMLFHPKRFLSSDLCFSGDPQM